MSRLMLFGSPRMARDDGPVKLVFERRSQLLAHLALRRGWVPRTELAAMLWPQTPADQAYANLRKTLFRTRGLPWAPAIGVQEQALSFEGTSDVAEFESAINQQRWADALDIANAPLLDGFDDDASEPWSAWLEQERVRVRAAWRTAAQHCLAATADPADILALSSRLLADDPLNESALRAQMLAHAQQGQPARARDAYRTYALLLADETSATPSSELKALHDALGAPGNTASGSSLRAVDGEPRIVGRTAERRTVRERLEQGCRLLCLLGPGGVGKSSLARQLLSELAPAYPDGSAFIPLEDVDSPDAVGSRLARELSVRIGSAEPLQAVIAFLSGRRMLLVLDNFEHLRPAARQLQQLLDACPRAQLLVTSRVRLGLAGEHLLPLDGLPCPEAEDADCLETFDAARLFVRAAQAVEPALDTRAEASAIIDICRLVDGLPLALEIAAGWTRVLSCQTIAAELRMGIELLSASDAARPARHASMAAVFEQSWRRLSPAEREAWARLTVFQGGFTPEAARAVAGATLPVLAALADHSLLRKTGARADLHPLLRQLAAAHLTGDERDSTQAAHSAHYLKWLVPLHRPMRGGDKQSLQQVELEFENVRAAWQWACLNGPVSALQTAVLPLMKFCDLQGRFVLGLALLREAADGVGANDEWLRPLLDAASAHLEFRLERYADAQARAERALRACRATRDHQTRLQCYTVLGSCASELGRLPLARRRFRQALAQASAESDPRNATGMRMNLAIVEGELGHDEAARALYMQVLIEQRRSGDARGEAITLINLAAQELWLDHTVDMAAAHLEAALALSERHALTTPKMMALLHLTDASVRRNDAAAARRHGERAFELAGQLGARVVQTLLRLHFAQLAACQRDFAAARDSVRAGVEDALALDHVPLQLDCVLSFACVLAAQGETGAAIRLTRHAVNHPATNVPVRDRARRRLDEWSSLDPDAAALPAPAIDLWTLLHRIVAEAPAAHAALIGSLRVP